jgi:hydroxymethylpyrimidine pyrophosphatase-like HAD family hydrolase
MKIKKGFVLQNVAGSYLACATGDLTREFSGVVRMNATGAFIWEILQGGAEKGEIVKKVSESYGISEEVAERDVTAFISYLNDNGVIEG